MKKLINYLSAFGCLFLAFIIFFSLTGHAVSISSLYQHDQPVATNTPSSWQKAVRHALGAVLVKVSGNADIMTNNEILSRLGQIDRFVERYQYYRDVNKQLHLRTTFNVNAVNTLLRFAKQAIWPNERPLLVAWLVVQPNQQLSSSLRHVLPADNALIVNLQAHLEARGLPSVFPMFDLQDRNAATLQAIWSFNLLELRNASVRYAAEDMLVGRLEQQIDGRWKASWLLQWEGGVTSWHDQLDTTDLQQVLIAGFDKVVDKVVSRYAVFQDGREQKDIVILQIANVADIEDYAAIVHYLRSLPSVTDLQTEDLDAGSQIVKLRLELQGGLQAFQYALQEQHKLVSVDGASGGVLFANTKTLPARVPEDVPVPTDSVLHYRWHKVSAAHNASVRLKG